MSARTEEYARRRAALQQQCAAQREELSAATLALQSRLQGVDRGLALFRGSGKSPLWMAGGAALALALGFRRIAGLVQLIGRVGPVISFLRRMLARR